LLHDVAQAPSRQDQHAIPAFALTRLRPGKNVRAAGSKIKKEKKEW
jgi:hypothetical protein